MDKAARRHIVHDRFCCNRESVALRVNHERDRQDVRDRRGLRFEVLGSKFRKPRKLPSLPSSDNSTLIIEHSQCASPDPLFSQVSRK